MHWLFPACAPLSIPMVTLVQDSLHNSSMRASQVLRLLTTSSSFSNHICRIKPINRHLQTFLSCGLVIYDGRRANPTGCRHDMRPTQLYYVLYQNTKHWAISHPPQRKKKQPLEINRSRSTSQNSRARYGQHMTVMPVLGTQMQKKAMQVQS